MMKNSKEEKLLKPYKKKEDKKTKIKYIIHDTIDINDEIKILRETLINIIYDLKLQDDKKYEEFLKYNSMINDIKKRNG